MSEGEARLSYKKEARQDIIGDSEGLSFSGIPKETDGSFRLGRNLLSLMVFSTGVRVHGWVFVSFRTPWAAAS